MKMGIADAIVDLVSSGTTLRENNLKEIEGGVVLESQVTLSHTCTHILERNVSFLLLNIQRSAGYSCCK